MLMRIHSLAAYLQLQGVLDGVATLSSNNNIIENAIEGVNLTLKGKTDRNQPPAEIG
ncbi:hypothetical protein ID065_13980, partial [Vibrio cholerae]